MAVDERILNQVAQMLNRTAERGCTEAEVQEASKKVQELLLKHNIEMAMVHALTEDNTKPKSDVGHVDVEMTANGRIQNYDWCLRLAGAVSYACTCQWLWMQRARSLTFVGRATDVRVAQDLYQFLVDQIEFLSIKAAWNIPDGLVLGMPGTRPGILGGREVAVPKGFRRRNFSVNGDTGAYRQSFLLGCATRVAQRLEEQANVTRQDLDRHGEVTALVAVTKEMIDGYVSQQFALARPRKSRQPLVRSRDGFAEGYDAGGSVMLTNRPKLQQ